MEGRWETIEHLHPSARILHSSAPGRRSVLQRPGGSQLSRPL